MADVLLIVPPFASVEFQSLALHNLQAVALKKGYKVDIRYMNMEVATLLGPVYTSLCNMNYFQLGERLFAKAAWGNLVGEQFNSDIYNYNQIYGRDKNPVRFFPDNSEIPIDELTECENKCLNWAKGLEADFSRLDYKFIGVTSSFDQNNAAITILKALKKVNEDTITFLGGFNCEKDMVKGIESLDPEREFIDYIFSGESEVTFPLFLEQGGWDSWVIYSLPVKDLDSIPNLDYSDYFKQQEHFFPQLTDSGLLSLAMEQSRGCWWGEKSQCSFCGTSDRVCFREKSITRIKEEIEASKKWDVNRLHMADLIMPEKNLTELLPYLAKKNEGWNIYFEQKVSLNFKEFLLLKKAGITEIQPGIETLNSSILKLMKKGTSIRKNIDFLRDATTVGFEIFWNIVWGIPGEKLEFYKEINRIVPLLVHLEPPIGMFHMTLVRFSPYFTDPESFGIEDIEPLPSYYNVYPKFANIQNLALIHRCKYKNENVEDDTEIEILTDKIESWKNSWNDKLFKPRLEINKTGAGTLIVLDTRNLGFDVNKEIEPTDIDILLTSTKFKGTEKEFDFINRGWAIKEGEYFIPLVIISQDVRSEYGKSS